MAKSLLHLGDGGLRLAEDLLVHVSRHPLDRSEKVGGDCVKRCVPALGQLGEVVGDFGDVIMGGGIGLDGGNEAGHALVGGTEMLRNASSVVGSDGRGVLLQLLHNHLEEELKVL